MSARQSYRLIAGADLAESLNDTGPWEASMRTRVGLRDGSGRQRPPAIGLGMQSVRPYALFRKGIIGGTIHSMAMTLRLDEQESEALRIRAAREGRSMQDVARQAIRDYVERTSRRELLDQVLDEGLPRYAEALRRLGQ